MRMLEISKDYSVINNVKTGTIYELLDKIDFNSLCNNEYSYFKW